MKLLHVFPLVASHPKNITEIRKLILQLGISGRLTSSWRQVNTAVRISVREWFELTQKGSSTGKKPKPINSNSHALPFDLPETWAWLKLDDLTFNFGQKTPTEKFTYIDVGSIDNTQGVISDKVKIIEANLAPSRARKIVQKNSVIYSTVRPYLLNVAIFDKSFEYEPIVSTAFAVLHPIEGLDSKYLFYYLRSNTFMSYVDSQMTGVAYPAINDANLMNGHIAVPPFEEQLQIIRLIESLLHEVDQLENLLNQRSFFKETLITHTLTNISSREVFKIFHSNFSLLFDDLFSIKKLRELILQLAIQGQLTARWRKENPIQEPASELLKRIAAEKEQLIKEKKISKEKPLPPIKEEEVPYELPKEWIWCRFGELGITQTGSTPSKSRSEYFGNFIPFLSPGDISNSRIIYPETGLSKLGLEKSRLIQSGSLMMVCIGGSIGKCNITAMDVACNQQINTLFPISIPSSMVKIIAQSPYFQSVAIKMASGSATPIINKSKWESIFIPLPPLSEQHPLIEKVNTLLAYCDELEQQVQKRKFDLDLLMQSILSEVFGTENRVIGNKTAETDQSKKEAQIPSVAFQSIYEENSLNMELPEILQQQGGKIAAVNLWKLSKYQKDIDAFYEALKKEVEEKKTIKESAEKGWLELVEK